MFPFEQALVPYCGDERDYTRENLYTHPSLQLLAKHINLQNSTGFVRMILLDDPSQSIFKWVPRDIYYGIPLFDASLNHEVCEKIEQCHLFSEQNLSKYSKKCRELSLSFLDFIAENGGTVDSASLGKPNQVGHIPLPTTIVMARWLYCGRSNTEITNSTSTQTIPTPAHLVNKYVIS